MQNCASAKNSQVAEQKVRINALMTSLTDEIGQTEARFQECLRQEPIIPKKDCEKLQEQKVELASWLSSIAIDLESKIMALQSIINRCEL